MWYLSNLSLEEQIWLQKHAKNYLIIDNNLYLHGGDCTLCRYLTHEEAKKILNDFYGGVCGGHLFKLEIAQKILWVMYFWP